MVTTWAGRSIGESCSHPREGVGTMDIAVAAQVLLEEAITLLERIMVLLEVAGV